MRVEPTPEEIAQVEAYERAQLVKAVRIQAKRAGCDPYKAASKVLGVKVTDLSALSRDQLYTVRHAISMHGITYQRLP